ncbi:MAG: diadenylate cyclase CdaA [Lachnospiraceae bacterium]|nr:diadenylate cyclase CdaA [Lachnospiraceae bacterium]
MTGHFFNKLASFSGKYLTNIHFPDVMWTDVVEIIIISVLIYNVLVWIKNTKAWALMKGIVVILGFVILAALFNMSTILWITRNLFSVAVTALIVVFQPELRKALESLGRRNVFSNIFQFEASKIADELFSDETCDAIIHASYAMGRAKTGALIVIENNDSLIEYERTGIAIDSIISSQLLINIFEHNTPLHDGAIVVRGNRIVAATCYLPLSDNRELSKELGTRHRAAVGISEVTDSLTVVVSEETGKVSVAMGGELYRNLDAAELKEKLELLQNKVYEEKKLRFWKGWSKNEKNSDK